MGRNKIHILRRKRTIPPSRYNPHQSSLRIPFCLLLPCPSVGVWVYKLLFVVEGRRNRAITAMYYKFVVYKPYKKTEGLKPPLSFFTILGRSFRQNHSLDNETPHSQPNPHNLLQNCGRYSLAYFPIGIHYICSYPSVRVWVYKPSYSVAPAPHVLQICS